MQHTTMLGLIARHAEKVPDRPAITAPDRAPLSYGGLHNLATRVGVQLNGFGVGRNHAVAVVLPNGPEMAAAFVAIASHAAVAPLNPRYRAPEFEFYLNDLDARALVVSEGDESPAIEVAKSRGIPILTLRVPRDAQAGAFDLVGADVSPSEPAHGVASVGDTALILHTSGTTSRPKMVPLSHGNLMASAANISSTLGLTQDDRCLNIMPLFHIHGLMAAVLASLHAGASVSCTPGFLAPRFFEWMADQDPTWYTAVPTMHQGILSRAPDHRDIIARCRLRFIRSSSASLAPQLIAALEDVFGVPLIEAYGMTEAAHQIASNPRPPRQRKPGSVGVAAGPAVQIMSPDREAILGPNETGEVVIQGDNVTAGYAANPEANANAFTKGWFRTGDQGHVDADGYLFLTGRLKEIINRGGEKISPREIDEILLAHPSVRQAVAFAMPDERLGEEVGAAVVLADGRTVTEHALRSFAAERLADFKVPKRVVIVDEIPVGATGKLQRIGLARLLGLDGAAEPREPVDYVAPRGEIEEFLAELWMRVLRRERVGTRDRFLDVGGDSMLAAQLVADIQTALNIDFSILDFFNAPTIGLQAEFVERMLLADVGSGTT